MKRAIILLILVAGGLGAADRWKLYAYSQDQPPFIYYYDSETLRYRGTSREPNCNCDAVVWTKTMNPNGTYRMARWELHRPSNMMRRLEAVEYNASGDVTDAKPEPSEWTELVPESVGELLFNAIFPGRRGKI